MCLWSGTSCTLWGCGGGRYNSSILKLDMDNIMESLCRTTCTLMRNNKVIEVISCVDVLCLEIISYIVIFIRLSLVAFVLFCLCWCVRYITCLFM